MVRVFAALFVIALAIAPAAVRADGHPRAVTPAAAMDCASSKPLALAAEARDGRRVFGLQPHRCKLTHPPVRAATLGQGTRPIRPGAARMGGGLERSQPQQPGTRVKS